MKKRRMLYTILFCIWIGINYFGDWYDATERLEDNLAHRDPPIFLSSFQIWFFNVLNHVFDSAFIAIATGVFAYHYRNLERWHYIALALFLRYSAIVLLLPFALWKHSLSELFESLRAFVPTHHLVVTALIQCRRSGRMPDAIVQCVHECFAQHIG